jgi:hypothetical protein
MDNTEEQQSRAFIVIAKRLAAVARIAQEKLDRGEPVNVAELLHQAHCDVACECEEVVRTTVWPEVIE